MTGRITMTPYLTLTQGCLKSHPFYLPALLSLIYHQVMLGLKMHYTVEVPWTIFFKKHFTELSNYLPRILSFRIPTDYNEVARSNIM